MSEGRCQCDTRKGVRCSHRGKTVYDGKLVCDVHLRTIKANDDCPICMEAMTPHNRVDACGHQHYFHPGCLKQCTKRFECPTCKQAISNKAFRKVHSHDHKRILDKVFELTSKQQYLMFEYIVVLTFMMTALDVEEAVAIANAMYKLALQPADARKQALKQLSEEN